MNTPSTSRWTLSRRVRPANRPSAEIRAGELVDEVQRRLEQVLEAGLPGAPEPMAVRRGLQALVVELGQLAAVQAWDKELEVLMELQLSLESPSKLVGLGRKLRAGLAGLEQRLWDRVTAAMPSLLSEQEWQRRVA